MSNIIRNYRYVGERVLQKCGEYVELVELLDNARCKVRFDSGVEKNCTRNAFRQGLIRTGDVRTEGGKSVYIGSRVLQNCGEYAEIVELLPHYRCIVRFDSGVEKECSIGLFRYGGVVNKNRTTLSIGDRVLQSCGEEAEIVDLLPSNKCVVRFDNGVEKVCARWLFAQGGVSENNRGYIGERILQKCGAVAEIVELLDNCNCSVRFSDGSKQVCSRRDFKRCIITPPMIKGHYVGLLRREDETKYMKVLV